MSVPASRSEGEFAFSYWLSCRKRPSSYLRKNLAKALNLAAMGTTTSTFKTISARPAEAQMASHDDDDDDDEEGEMRPFKRRRVQYRDVKNAGNIEAISTQSRPPFDQVTNGSMKALQLSAKPGLMEPSEFYGRSRLANSTSSQQASLELTARPNQFSLDSILPKHPAEFRPSFRLDLVGIDGPVGKFWKDLKKPVEIKCRCSAALFYGKNDQNEVDVRPQHELCRLVKTCIFRMSVERNGEVTRKLSLSEPFVFSQEQFYVNRKRRKSNGQGTKVFAFADVYAIQLAIEPMPLHAEWPPLDIEPKDLNHKIISDAIGRGDIESDEVQLYCRLDPVQDQDKCSRLPLLLTHSVLKGPKQPLLYTINVDLGWALPSQLAPLHRAPNFEQMEDVEPASALSKSHPVMVSHAGQSATPSPRTRPVSEDSAINSSAESRSHRRRNEPTTYNLKALSTIAQGRSPKARKASNKSRSKQVDSGEEISVTYRLGRADAGSLVVKQHASTVAGLHCLFCKYRYESVDRLTLHLQTDHSNFKFSLRRGTIPRVVFLVEVVRSRLETAAQSKAELLRTCHLGQPTSLLDLEEYMNGNDSWAKSRRGPQHNAWPEHLHNQGLDNSRSSSPPESRRSSPNTSHATDDVFEYEAKLPIRPRKVYYVPKTSKPLYDTITKRVLSPGQELPSSDDEKDETWLNLKHRDLINDFEDVPPEEKEFIHRWNPFITRERLTSDKFIPDAMVRFVEANKGWLAGHKDRKHVWSQQVEVFLLRGVMDQSCADKCLGIINEFEQAEAAKDDDVVMEQAPIPPKSRGMLTCSCGEHTQAPNRVVCRGAKCPQRFFCRKCAQGSGRQNAGPWHCDNCLLSPARH